MSTVALFSSSRRLGGSSIEHLCDADLLVWSKPGNEGVSGPDIRFSRIAGAPCGRPQAAGEKCVCGVHVNCRDGYVPEIHDLHAAAFAARVREAVPRHPHCGS
jgi:hypothetical protein